MSVQTIQILDRRSKNDKRLVDASLKTDLTLEDLINTEKVWNPIRLTKLIELIKQGTPESKLPQHCKWDWGWKALKLKLLDKRVFSIEYEGSTQGLVMVSLSTHQTRIEPIGRPLVYIDYIETAPWNSREFTTKPDFAGIGSRLFEAVIRLSIKEGFRGRVALHSLPQSEGFYSSTCGMQNLGPDSHTENLPYYELTVEKAQEFLKDD